MTDLEDRMDNLEKQIDDKTKETTDKIGNIENTLKHIQDSMKMQPSHIIKEVSENTDEEINWNTEEQCIESLKCDYCDLIGKTEGGLKTHMRFKHTRIMNQQNWKHCTFCNYNCKTESEMKVHMLEYEATHSQTNTKNKRGQLNAEISKLSDNGYTLYACELAEARKQHLEQQQHFAYNC